MVLRCRFCDRSLLGQRGLERSASGLSLGLGIVEHLPSYRLFCEQALGPIQRQLRGLVLYAGTLHLRIGIHTNGGKLRTLCGRQACGQKHDNLSCSHTVSGLWKLRSTRGKDKPCVRSNQPRRAARCRRHFSSQQTTLRPAKQRHRAKSVRDSQSLLCFFRKRHATQHRLTLWLSFGSSLGRALLTRHHSEQRRQRKDCQTDTKRCSRQKRSWAEITVRHAFTLPVAAIRLRGLHEIFICRKTI